MHKKLEADLVSLAHSILQMKNKDDVFALAEKANLISSTLSMLAFVETYVNTTPNLETTKEELISKVEKAFENKALQEDLVNQTTIIDQLEAQEEKITEVTVMKEEPVLEQPFDELEAVLFSSEEPVEDSLDDVKETQMPTLEEELKDTFPVDMMANLFESVQPKSLNDSLTNNIQFDLNDRIAFVKNLFDGSQEDFNRVVSQLNSFKTAKEAKKFINKMVKPDYNWSEHEAFEIRFMEIIQRKFL
jgi:hypothetical protein